MNGGIKYQNKKQEYPTSARPAASLSRVDSTCPTQHIVIALVSALLREQVAPPCPTSKHRIMKTTLTILSAQIRLVQYVGHC